MITLVITLHYTTVPQIIKKAVYIYYRYLNTQMYVENSSDVDVQGVSKKGCENVVINSGS